MDDSVNEIIESVIIVTLTALIIMFIIWLGMFSRDFIAKRYDRQSEKYAAYYYEKAIKYDDTLLTADKIIQFIQSNTHKFNIEVHISSSNIYKATIGNQYEWSVYRWQEILKDYSHEEFVCEVINTGGTVEKIQFIIN